MAFRAIMVALLMEGALVCALGAIVAPNGAPFVLGAVVCGGGLAWLLEPRS